MAYIHYRRVGSKSEKRKWVPMNRKYKWLFYTHLLLDLVLATIYVYTLMKVKGH